MTRIVWRGPLVAARTRRAQIVGINKTMADCVVESKGLVHVDTGTLQGSLRLEGARAEGNGARGQWGSFDVIYAIYQELLPPSRGGKAFMRPSADSNYRKLVGYIRAAL